MPQIVIVMLAGAGLYAGYRWIARQISGAAQAAERAAEDLRRRAREATSGVPKDLGALEWDENAGVYKPKRDQ